MIGVDVGCGDERLWIGAVGYVCEGRVNEVVGERFEEKVVGDDQNLKIEEAFEDLSTQLQRDRVNMGRSQIYVGGGSERD